MSLTIAGLIIARNEAEMIANALETLGWCDEVIVIDNGSSDATAELAKRAGARVIRGEGSFADLRNQALAHTKADWVFYLDADERVTPALATEIKAVIQQPDVAAFSVARKNVLYGSWQQSGGWWPDRVVRLFQRQNLKTWTGDVHEHAEVTGVTKDLQEALWHLTHRSVVDGLLKSSEWTPIEARLLAASKIGPVTGLTMIRKAGMEFFRRLVFKQGWKDGQAGWVEALIQGANRLLVYAQVWELQQQPLLPDRYQQLEESIARSWKRQANVTNHK